MVFLLLSLSSTHAQTCPAFYSGNTRSVKPNILLPTSPYTLTTKALATNSSFSISFPGCTLPYSVCNHAAPGTFLELTATSNSSDYLCGVDLLDVLLIQRHILGVQAQPLWAQVGGDVNMSRTLTSSDMVTIRQLILGSITAFPNVESWEYFMGYVPHYSLVNIADAWDRQTATLSGGASASFYHIGGAKMGDVNYSCSCGLKEGLSKEPLHIAFSTENTVATVSSNGRLALQASLKFPEFIDMADLQIDVNQELGLTQEDIRVSGKLNLLNITALSKDGKTPFDKNDWIVRITSKSGRELELELVEDFRNVGVDLGLETHSLYLQFTTDEVSTKMDVLTVYPQPVRDHCTIVFKDKMAGDIEMKVLSSTDSHSLISNFYHDGTDSEIRVDFGDLPKGLYQVALKSASGIFTFKVIKI
jgi:hypothetical protein